MTIQNTDLLVVQRDSTAYKVNFENLKTSVIDGLDETQRTTIIADADGQRDFYFYDEVFTADKVQVYLNGAFLDESVYEVQMDRVLLDVGAEIGDTLDLIQPIIPEGVIPLPYDRQTFQVASATQSAFNLTAGIVNGVEHVYLNGKLLDSTSDYTFSSDTVTLAVAAEQNDILEVLQPETIQGATYIRKKFAVTANTQRVFGFGSDRIVAGSELVFLNGALLLAHGDYNITDRRLELNVVAEKGDLLELITNNLGNPFPLYQDLFYVPADDHGAVGITHGNWATIPGATDDVAGLLTAKDKAKLDGIEEGAKDNKNISWNDVTNKPVIGDGTLTVKDSKGAVVQRFSANQTDNADFELPSTDYNDLDNLPNPVLRKTITVSDATQTVFNTAPVKITSGSELVYLNGTLLTSGDDYDVTGDNEITLDTAAELGDVFELLSNDTITGERLSQNLGYRKRASSGVVTITDGSNAVIDGATTTNAGLLAASDKSKLDGIEEGAEVNVQSDWNAASSSDAYIKNRPDTVVESITAGAGVTVSNGGIGDVTIACTVEQLEFGGSADVTTSTVPSTTFNAVPLAIADFYVNVGFGKFSPEWAAVTTNADTNTDADPGDYLVYNGTGFEHIPSGTPPAADALWIAAGGKLEPVNKSDQLVIGSTVTNISLDITGKATSTATASSDGSTTLTTKGYVDGLIPDVNNGKLTINDSEGTQLGAFTANQSSGTTINLPAPFSGDYNDLTNRPSLSGFLTAVQVTAPITVDNSNSTQPKIGINLSTISNIDNI